MDRSHDLYGSLPKVDLHRHLEGSLRLRTMLEIARANGMTVPLNKTGPLSNLVQVHKTEPFTYQNFLAKFDTLRLFYRSPEVILRVTREAVEDAASDNVRYLELRFTPVALSRAERFPLGDVMDWVCDAVDKAASEFGICVRLIASVNRHESLELAEQVAWLAAERIGRGLVGLDLAGNEAEFPARPFLGILKEARQAGLKLTVHAGEWAGAENVREAIEIFKADRIGHGVRVLEDPKVVEIARRHATAFEVCITSNFQSGSLSSGRKHPLLDMLQQGLNVSICTDDPAISQITLADEYRRACDDLGLKLETLKERILAALQAAFLSEDDRLKLTGQLRREFGLLA